jgi:hypothetical protein
MPLMPTTGVGAEGRTRRFPRRPRRRARPRRADVRALFDLPGHLRHYAAPDRRDETSAASCGRSAPGSASACSPGHRPELLERAAQPPSSASRCRRGRAAVGPAARDGAGRRQAAVARGVAFVFEAADRKPLPRPSRSVSAAGSRPVQLRPRQPAQPPPRAAGAAGARASADRRRGLAVELRVLQYGVTRTACARRSRRARAGTWSVLRPRPARSLALERPMAATT